MKIILAENELINAIAVRDPAGAAALYDQYAGMLFKIICCSIRDQKMAVAVLEETLVFIWNNCNDCRKQDKRLLLWMAGIARRLARKNVEEMDRLI